MNLRTVPKHVGLDIQVMRTNSLFSGKEAEARAMITMKDALKKEV